ncbi:hypothetical protein [Labrys neptuniae]
MSRNLAADLREPDDFISDPLQDAWTPELVLERMVEAFEILPHISGTVGPGRFTTTWPAVFRDLSMLVGELFSDPGKDPEPPPIRPRPPTADEVARAEEALCWPALYLADMPKAADALNVWAACKASGRSIRKTMEDRCRRATARAQMTELKQKAKRRRIAAGVAAWANAEIAKAAGDQARVDQVKAEAHDRLRDELEKADLIVVRLITPEEAMPGIVMSKDSLDWQRYRAAEQIVARLARHHSGSGASPSSLSTQILSIS